MMSMETAGLVRQVDKLIKKKRYSRRVRIHLKRSADVVSLTLQRLFNFCQRVFKGHGTVPSSSDVQKMCQILDVMTPEDVGLNKDLHFFKLKTEHVEETPRVTSATIYKCDNFEISIFFLPANAVIPLHNHPEMTVFSKLLLGSMHIKSYDWIDPLNSSSSNLRLAKLKENKTFTSPSNASVLYPTSGGNIHEFTAITPCAILDVIGPPYSNEPGCDCSYYKDTPCDENEAMLKKVEEDDGHCCYSWLEEIETPEESEMDAIEYRGPQVIINHPLRGWSSL